MHKKNGSKVVIIGLGAVGATCAYTLLLADLVQELILIDIHKEKALGEAMDLQHSLPLLSAAQVKAGTYADCRDADIIIFSAGVPQKEGESRLSLLERNAQVLSNVLSSVLTYTKDSIFLVVTNPVDVLTYLAQKWSHLPKNKVIGSGTVLDTSRLKNLLSRHTQVDPRNIHTYVLGEHGDSEFPAWELTSIAGLRIQDYCRQCENCQNLLPERLETDFHTQVSHAAYEIIRYKGATYYGVATAVSRICEAILKDERSLLTVSSFVEGICGLPDVCLSLPCVLGENGVERILEPALSPKEQQTLQRSGLLLQQTLSAFASHQGPKLSSVKV